LAISPTEVDYLHSHTEIEMLVAAGFGLAAKDLAIVFDPDESDRRGFWRAYRRDPDAALVAARILGRPPGSPSAFQLPAEMHLAGRSESHRPDLQPATSLTRDPDAGK